MSLADSNRQKAIAIIESFPSVESTLQSLYTCAITGKTAKDVDNVLAALDAVGIYFDSSPIFVNNGAGELIEFPRIIID